MGTYGSPTYLAGPLGGPDGTGTGTGTGADTKAAVAAVDLVKVYGTGETGVRALDGVTVGFARGRFTAIMGPSGSGKSTLMHCLAGLDTASAGRVLLGDTDLTRLSDRALTAVRRDRVGFVFQSFNLLPQLTAAQNITLPLGSGRAGRSTAAGSSTSSPCWAWPTGSATGRASCPAASSSGWRWPGRWSPGRRWCSPTNPPATSTHAPARRCSGSCATRPVNSGRRS